MRTGSLLEVAAVLKGSPDAEPVQATPFREKKMLERARYLLVSELAMAKNTRRSQIDEMLAKALAKSSCHSRKHQICGVGASPA